MLSFVYFLRLHKLSYLTHVKEFAKTEKVIIKVLVWMTRYRSLPRSVRRSFQFKRLGTHVPDTFTALRAHPLELTCRRDKDGPLASA